MEELKARLMDTMEQRVKRLEEDRERVLKQCTYLYMHVWVSCFIRDHIMSHTHTHETYNPAPLHHPTVERVGQATRVLRSKAPSKGEHEHPELAQLTGAAAHRLNGEDGGAALGGVGGGGAGGASGNGVSMFLSDAEIKDDLKAISTDLAARARAYYDASGSGGQPMVDCSVEDGCLHYGEHCLLKGEAVVFTSMLSGEDFFGRIASIRPGEVLVKLSDGTKARIHLAYLKNGRIKLKVSEDGAQDD